MGLTVTPRRLTSPGGRSFMAAAKRKRPPITRRQKRRMARAGVGRSSISGSGSVGRGRDDRGAARLFPGGVAVVHDVELREAVRLEEAREIARVVALAAGAEDDDRRALVDGAEELGGLVGVEAGRRNVEGAQDRAADILMVRAGVD